MNTDEKRERRSQNRRRTGQEGSGYSGGIQAVGWSRSGLSGENRLLPIAER
jgi:hypothetical protein